MELVAFATLVVPFMLVVYLGVLFFVRPPKMVIIASLLGGLTMGVINMLFDLAAYYAHWWHYTLNGLILHLPLPFYASPILIYGGIAFLLIWRFQHGRGHWFALLLLIGVPLFRAALDILGALVLQSYTQFDSVFAAPIDLLMWLTIFYSGFLVFTRLATGEQKSETERMNARGTI
jgi:hypothetical protein